MHEFELRRRLLGYHPEDVERLRSELEAALAESERRAGKAEDRARELEVRLASVQEEADRLREESSRLREDSARLREQVERVRLDSEEKDRQLASLRAEVEALRAELEVLREEAERIRRDPVAALGGDPLIELLARRVAPILRNAERAAAQLIEETEVSVRRHRADAERIHRELAGQRARVEAWREQLQPLIRSVQNGVREARGRIAEIPDRVQGALAPVADQFASLAEDLAALLHRATPPLLRPPSEAEEGETDRPGPRGGGGAWDGKGPGAGDHPAVAGGTGQDPGVSGPEASVGGSVDVAAEGPASRPWVREAGWTLRRVFPPSFWAGAAPSAGREEPEAGDGFRSAHERQPDPGHAEGRGEPSKIEAWWRQLRDATRSVAS